MFRAFKESVSMVFIALAIVGPFQSFAAEEMPDRDAVRAAFESCLNENNLEKPESGERPSDEDRIVIEECMKGKGFEKPSGHGRGGPQGRGERPARDDAAPERRGGGRAVQ